MLDVCSNRGAKHEMGEQGTIGPTLATTCFYCTNTSLFHCAIWVYLKSLSGSLHVTVEH